MLDLGWPVPQLAGLGPRAHDRFARLLCEHLEQTVSIAADRRHRPAPPVTRDSSSRLQGREST